MSAEITDRGTLVVELRCVTCGYWQRAQLGWTGAGWRWEAGAGARAVMFHLNRSGGRNS